MLLIFTQVHACVRECVCLKSVKDKSRYFEFKPISIDTLINPVRDFCVGFVLITRAAILYVRYTCFLFLFCANKEYYVCFTMNFFSDHFFGNLPQPISKTYLLNILCIFSDIGHFSGQYRF